MADKTWRIRKAGADDADAIAGMGDAIQKLEFELVGAPVRPVEAVSAIYRERVAARLGEAGAAAFVAESGGAALGYVLGRIEDEGDPFVDADFSRHALVADLYVAPEQRGRGVGRALIEAFAAVMAAKGAKWLRVHAKAKNRVAIETYLGCGFEPYETIFVRRIGGGEQ